MALGCFLAYAFWRAIYKLGCILLNERVPRGQSTCCGPSYARIIRFSPLVRLPFVALSSDIVSPSTLALKQPMYPELLYLSIRGTKKDHRGLASSGTDGQAEQ